MADWLQQMCNTNKKTNMSRMQLSSQVSTFFSEKAIMQFEANNTCAVNVDGKCVPTLPAVSIVAMQSAGNGVTVPAASACPQRSPLFCAGNQPYSSNAGYACATKPQTLVYQGV